MSHRNLRISDLQDFEEFFDEIIENISNEDKTNSKPYILLIDEIGKMELFGRKFQQKIIKLIKDSKLSNSNYHIICTISLGGGMIEKIKNLPEVDKVLNVTRQNRDGLIESEFEHLFL